MEEHEVGFFEAEKVDERVKGSNPKPLKTIKFTNFLSLGVELPEAGTWHVDRKRRILAKYPKVRELFGENPFSVVVLAVVFFLQYQLAIFAATLPIWGYLLLAYTLGSLFSFQIIVMGHEATHRLITKSAFWSKVIAVVAFLPVFLGPFGIFWAVEHMWHHNVVVDKCMRFGRQSNNIVRKMIFASVHFHLINFLFGLASALACVVMLLSLPLNVVPYLQGKKKTPFLEKTRIPPYSRFPQLLDWWLLVNCAASFAFNYYVVATHGVWAWAFFWVTGGFSNGLHPLGLRNVQEHYHLSPDQPTSSIYGHPFFNYLTLFIGHHVEHHDFPTIPWNRLQYLRVMAPEFYKDLKFYHSYTEVLWFFLFSKGVDEKLLLPDGFKSH